jgi:site-specific DNA recombinase
VKKGTVLKTAAIYARVSSERQREEQTIESQVAALKEYAGRQGYTVPEEWVFRDEGYSGAVLVRPGLEKLRDLAAEGQIDNVLIYGPDRLSRRYAYQVLLMEELARCGVEVIFLKSTPAKTPEEELLVQFQGMIAEYERAQIAERTRRGKRHKAKAGSVNVLSGAPYGYRYIKRTETTPARYEIIEPEAHVVREVYRLYTEESMSIGGIVRWLNEQKVPTRKGISRWERTTIWAMLRNPTYRGAACFGKTESVPRQKITRALRQRGGFSARCSCSRERDRAEWVEIPVPATVSEVTFALAGERLQRNKALSSRNTKEPSLLQGMLVCQKCGYAYYRTSTRTSSRKLYYYRCLGSDDYRHVNGRICDSHPIRQDYLDAMVWEHIVRLLEDPELIKTEIDRRMQEMRDSSPTKRRKEDLLKEKTRLQNGADKLLDAYQEGLFSLEELRKRLPELRKRQDMIESELRSLASQAADQEVFIHLSENIETFLANLRESAQQLTVTDRQKILRLLVKEVLVGSDRITIKHSIPVNSGTGASNLPTYLLCKGSHIAPVGQPVSEPAGPQLGGPEDGGTTSGPLGSICGRLCRPVSPANRRADAGDPSADGKTGVESQRGKDASSGRLAGPDSFSGFRDGNPPQRAHGQTVSAGDSIEEGLQSDQGPADGADNA